MAATLDDINVDGKRILVRVDWNVPIKDGVITDAARIERTIPTIRELLDKKAVVILLSHLGRPKGEVNKEFSLQQIHLRAEHLLGHKIEFITDDQDPALENKIQTSPPGKIFLLENVRFHKGEEKDDPKLAKKWARLGDLYVNDAFSAAHRAHASVHALPKLLPCAAGRLMQKELEALEKSAGNPQRPAMAVVGGAKVSTKVDLLMNLVKKLDYLVVGGGMANTFLLAQGKNIGASFCDRDSIYITHQIMRAAEKHKCEIILPVDVVVAHKLEPHQITHSVSVDDVPNDEMILDIASQTLSIIKQKLEKCNTLLWNGPLGVFEIKPFDAGTTMLAQYVAERTKKHGLISVAGGGDTASALKQAGVEKKFTYISSAGGAFLEWLEGKTLPGIEALEHTPAQKTG